MRESLEVEQQPRAAGPAQAVALQAALYLAIAVAFTWPLLPQLRTAVPSDPGDPLLNTWILWWNAQHIPLTHAAWDAPAFYPAHGVLAFSETLLGISLFGTPLQWLGASPQLVYNLAFLAAFALSALFMAVLAFELTGRRDAAFIAGLAFGFHPFRVAHFPQLQVLSSYFIPLGLYALHRYLREPKPRWLVCFALSWVLTGLINGYYLMFMSVLVGLWLVWFPRNIKTFAAIGGAWAIAVLLMLPVLLKYKSVHQAYGFTRHSDDIRSFSADMTAFMCTSTRLKLWGFLQHCKRPENELFPGLTLPLLVLAGALLVPLRAAGLSVRRWFAERSSGFFYLAAAFAMWLFSLGPRPSFNGHEGPLPGPYSVLMLLPGFHSLRVPARFATLMMLCLAATGAWAFAKLAPRLGRARWPVCVLLCVGILADVWLREMPIAEQPRPIALEQPGTGVPLLELPMERVPDLSAMYRSQYHGRPVVNGYSGYAPPYYFPLKDLLNGRDPAGLTALASFGPIEIVLDQHADPDGKLSSFLQAAPIVERVRSDATHALFRLPASPSANDRTRTAPKLAIAALHASSSEDQLAFLTDGDVTTRWSAGSQRGGEQVLSIDLGRVQPVGSVVLVLGGYSRDYPRDLLVEIADAEAGPWTELWRGDTSGEALAASIRDRKLWPVTLAWPGERAARLIRLRNYGRAPDDLWWSVGELEVRAP